MTVNNGYAATLVIPGVHDGDAGVQRADGRIRVAFVPNERRAAPQRATSAILDGQAARVVSIERSKFDGAAWIAVLEVGQ